MGYYTMYSHIAAWGRHDWHYRKNSEEASPKVIGKLEPKVVERMV